jgi:hypothetical protein
MESRLYEAIPVGQHQKQTTPPSDQALKPILEGVRYVTASDYCDVLLISLFDRGIIRLPSASGVH